MKWNDDAIKEPIMFIKTMYKLSYWNFGRTIIFNTSATAFRGMSVLQNSLFDYNTALSQFLEARRQQHSTLGLGFFPVLGSASGSDTTESLSPSPPAVNNARKSFTIDAILGLRCKSSNSNSTVLDYSNPSAKKSNGKYYIKLLTYWTILNVINNP